MHIPVLLKESIEAMNLKLGDIAVDCTTNRGGHSLEIAKIIGRDGILICVDLDLEALKEAESFLLNHGDLQDKNKMYIGPKIHFVNDNFRNIKAILANILSNPPESQKVDAILADLGVSSQEIDISGRGFTFQKNEPLLMTLKDKETLQKDDLTAREIVNTWDEENIADIIYYYSDEKYAKRITKSICEKRKEKEIKTTFDLVSVIESAVPEFYKRSKIHFATKTFQALRIAVNDELGAERELIESLNEVLTDGGRASLITFHSGEDRVVKNFAKENKDKFELVKLVQESNRKYKKEVEGAGQKEYIKISKKDFLEPSREEVKNNARSRSAKLRVLEKL